MKWRWLLAAFALGGCAAKEPARPAEIAVTAGKTRIFLPAFLALDGNDLDQLTVGAAAKNVKGMKLSDGRGAECGRKSCVIGNGKTSRIPLTSKDIATFTALRKAAASAGKETTRVDGPITVRCTGDRCVADLLIETQGPVKMQGTVNVEAEPELDVAGSLLQGFVRGLIGK